MNISDREVNLSGLVIIGFTVIATTAHQDSHGFSSGSAFVSQSRSARASAIE